MSLSKYLHQQVQSLMSQMSNDIDKHAQILNDIRQLVIHDNPKPRTQVIRFSVIKKLFKTITDDAAFLNQIKPDSALLTEVCQLDNKIRDNRRLIDIDKATIDQLLMYAASDNVLQLFTFLLFVTGRRTNELFGSKFINEKGSKLIKMIGVSKRKPTDDDWCNFTPLISKTRFFDLYRRYKRIQTYANQQAFHKALSRFITREFKHRQYHPHTFRGIYIHYLYKFHNHNKLKINTFIMNHLHHQCIQTSLNYTQYHINNDIDTDIVAKHFHHTQ